ncbi:uncharacterized protein GLRG_11815 [Colletotrichum graminicola M1.001]|uniref:Uncharacterized protein n=1 Tax=Colletotrichum graminicola (strain M1.001 / M2 / FGSC 10212) TaxID=645133 RepID=E3R0N1_COLGM|nr:uncharacterized protein GLRG_11815 [Colletotrichum graminicola M1.001]EFQ36669.1 hypothetical protein GLRG_11815 [Colletotrichum graminicola M1.001]
MWYQHYNQQHQPNHKPDHVYKQQPIQDRAQVRPPPPKQPKAKGKLALLEEKAKATKTPPTHSTQPTNQLKNYHAVGGRNIGSRASELGWTSE